MQKSKVLVSVLLALSLNSGVTLAETVGTKGEKYLKKITQRLPPQILLIGLPETV